jgi:hypothetical protein
MLQNGVSIVKMELDDTITISCPKHNSRWSMQRQILNIVVIFHYLIQVSYFLTKQRMKLFFRVQTSGHFNNDCLDN